MTRRLIWIGIMIKKISHSLHVIFGMNCTAKRCITYEIIKIKFNKSNLLIRNINGELFYDNMLVNK
jgi:hypothetical protein